MFKPKKILGVLGGMGPRATLYFLDILLKMTPAQTDQEHIHTIIDINTEIPDRTTAIINNTPNDVELAIKKSVTRLKEANADFFVAPCNTVHYFIDALQSQPELPLFNLIEKTATSLYESGVKKVGLLATLGTVKSKLYQNYLEDLGITMIEPDAEQQDMLMHIIFNVVKKGMPPEDATSDLSKIISSYRTQGAEKIILGCTELPIVTQFIKDDILIDPLEVLAKACIGYASS
jgi:aspartate racemase